MSLTVVGLGMAAALLAAGCGSSSGPAPSATPIAARTPAATVAPSPTTSRASALPTRPPQTAPRGTTFVDIPGAGVRLPVPTGWDPVGIESLADPAARAALAAKYPGSGTLLAAVDKLGGRAKPAFLAVDPSAASSSGPLSANLSVLVSQPSVGGFLLDFAAGFIEDGLTEVLGSTVKPVRDRVQLPLGEAVRLRYAIPKADGEELAVVAWVIGAPSGTLLVTLMGTASALADIDPDAIADAIAPLTVAAP